MTHLISRRYILSLAIAAGAAGSMASIPAEAQDAQVASTVSGDDPLAVALGYVPDVSQANPKVTPARQPGAKCTNCSWYAPKADTRTGLCNYFPGKLVESNGWCRMWAGPKK